MGKLEGTIAFISGGTMKRYSTRDLSSSSEWCRISDGQAAESCFRLRQADPIP